MALPPVVVADDDADTEDEDDWVMDDVEMEWLLLFEEEVSSWDNTKRRFIGPNLAPRLLGSGGALSGRRASSSEWDTMPRRVVCDLEGGTGVVDCTSNRDQPREMGSGLFIWSSYVRAWDR